MDKKFIYIGGGVAALLVVGVIISKRGSSSEEPAQQSAPVMSDMAFLSSMAPSSGGNSSGGYSGPVEAAPTAGGGFDIGSIMGALVGVQKLATEKTASNNDAAILAGIVAQNKGGEVTVSHGTNGTTITTKPAGDLYDQQLTELYKKNFNRAPDTGGLAFYKNAMMNSGLSIVDVDKSMQQSDEYKKRQAA